MALTAHPRSTSSPTAYTMLFTFSRISVHAQPPAAVCCLQHACGVCCLRDCHSSGPSLSLLLLLLEETCVRTGATRCRCTSTRCTLGNPAISLLPSEFTNRRTGSADQRSSSSSTHSTTFCLRLTQIHSMGTLLPHALNRCCGDAAVAERAAGAQRASCLPVFSLHTARTASQAFPLPTPLSILYLSASQHAIDCIRLRKLQSD